MRKYILIVVAMDSELNEIKNNMIIEETIKFSRSEYYIGKYFDKDVILALSGIGKVNASIMTTHILTKYDVSYCISIGIAGGLNCNVGDFILVNKSYYADFDLRVFGYDIYQVPGFEFSTKDFMLDKLKDICLKKGLSYQVGSSFTLDQFVTSMNQIPMMKDDVKCVEMESNAILHACTVFNTDCIIIRAISDVVGVSSTSDYEEFERNSSILLNEFLKELFIE